MSEERDAGSRSEEPGEWSIQQVAALAGTTSRTLRHYDDLGLLVPSRVGLNGYRYYDADRLVQLQRILLLRQLGLGLPAIAEVLASQMVVQDALATHLDSLRFEAARLQRQIGSVQSTLDNIRKGRPLMAEQMLDGFDHTQYRSEVEARWGAPAYAASDGWWRGLTDDQQRAFGAEGRAIAASFAAELQAGTLADAPAAQALAARHVAWLTPALDCAPAFATPAAATQAAAAPAPASGRAEMVTAAYLTGLADLYVADDRFGRNYDRHGDGTAAYVSEALRGYAHGLG